TGTRPLGAMLLPLYHCGPLWNVNQPCFRLLCWRRRGRWWRRIGSLLIADAASGGSPASRRRRWSRAAASTGRALAAEEDVVDSLREAARDRLRGGALVNP